MASILRSGKFIRYFAGLTRNIVINTVRDNENSFVKNSQCFCNTLMQGFASAAVPRQHHALDRSLKRLDDDVRRTGRISRRDIEEILEEIRLQRSATSSQSLLVIRCCGDLVPEELPETRTALVQEIWKTLNNLNVPMDISHYNALLRVYLENEHPFSPADFLADLESKGIEPNRVTYHRFITRYCQQGDIEGATRILEYMKEKEIPVNENVFNALILGHSQAGDLESAVGILTVMKQAGLEPTADTYSTLLCCYARHGKVEDILRTVEDCEKSDIFLLDKDILDVIYNLAIHGHTEEIDKVIPKLRQTAGYNQDAINLILKLTNKGFEDVGYKVMQTMPRIAKPSGDFADAGNFFIRQLIKANRPSEKIISICKDMQENNLNSKALLVAIDSCFLNDKTNIALPLLKEIKKAGLPIRQHYFWPLICSSSSISEILDVLRKMQDEFNLQPSGETVREYVVPNMNEKNYDTIISLLRTVGVSPATSGVSAAFHALSKNKIREAANIASSYQAYYSPGLFRKPLIVALSKTNDFESYNKFIRCLYEGIPRGQMLHENQQDGAAAEDIEETVSTQTNQAEVVGQFVHDAVVYFRHNRGEFLEKILTGLVKEGLSISSHQAEKIQERLGADMTAEISELLGKLSAGELEPVHLERPTVNRRNALQSMTVDQLEEIIKHSEAKNENANTAKRYLLSACFKSRNLEKTLEVIDRLEQEKFVFSSGIYAQLIDLYAHHGKMEPALETYGKIKTKEPDFVLDNNKTIKLVELLLKNDNMNEAVDFLKKNKKESPTPEERNFSYSNTCWRLLNALAESKNVENLQLIFDTMIENNYVDVNNVVLGPLIKVHLLNDDLQKAVEKFEEICSKYRATPWKNELACRLIQAEDANNLQKLTDLSTSVHGEINSLYDLVFSFVECGRIRQARKILETPGLRNRPQRLNTACERYRMEGMVQPLEGLVEATKDLNHIDRSDIYYNLLLSYCKENQPEKALGLWTKMQEEDITPSDAFLLKLAEFLQEKNIEVPFVIPTVSGSTNEAPVNPPKRKQDKGTEPTRSETVRQFKRAITAGDADTAIQIRNAIKPSESLTVLDRSLLVELLVKQNRINEATKNVFDLIAENLHPIPRIFKFYCNHLAASGDTGTLEKIGEIISGETKKLISFDNRYCHANLVAGKVESYIQKLEEDIDAANTDEKVKEVGDKFPRGGALGILQNNPECIDKFEKLAEKYATKGIIGPMNVLWVYYFMKNNVADSDRVFEKYLSNCPRLMFQRIMQTAREQGSEDMVTKLIEKLKIAKTTEGALGNAYSCLLDIHSAKENFDKGLTLLKSAIEDVCLENINRTALMRLKTGVEKSGKSFPYEIPKRSSKHDPSSSSSSSSSSSDEEDLPPRSEPTIR